MFKKMQWSEHKPNSFSFSLSRWKMELTNIRILIVDDEVLIAETLKDHLIKLGYEKIELAHSKKEAETVLDNWKPDIALLDIRMEGHFDGLQLAEIVRTKYNIPFMYVTAHSDLAMTERIVKTKPDGYITKPIRINELMVNLGMVVQRFLENKEHLVSVKNGLDQEQFKASEILYLKAEGNYVEVHLEARKILVRNSLEALLSEMNLENIYRIHRSYAVNSHKVKTFSSAEIKINDIVLPVSRTYSAELREKLTSKKG
jgi:two-component system, LytTR family, response regulator LytT